MFGYEHDDAMRSNLRRFRVVKVYDDGTQQLLDLSGLKNEKPERVWRPQQHGFTSVPPEDSDGYMVGMGGRSDRMLYIDGGHKKYRPRNMKPGDVALYDDKGNIFKVVEAGAALAHNKSFSFKVGKGQDVSDNDGSKDPSSDDVNISIVGTTDGIVITVQDCSIRWRPGRLNLVAPMQVVVESPDINLGGEGGIAVKRIDDSPATRVKAI
jgi:phage gp45-like